MSLPNKGSKVSFFWTCYFFDWKNTEVEKAKTEDLANNENQ